MNNMSDPGYPIRFPWPDWEHMEFKLATREEWEAAHPCHRFRRLAGASPGEELYIAKSCSLCPDHLTP